MIIVPGIDKETYDQTIKFFENILKVLHPFMPFITEELWHDDLLGKRTEYDCCIIAQLPNYGEINAHLLTQIEVVKQAITQIRNIRNNKKLSPKEKLSLSIKANSTIPYKSFEPIITKLGNISILDIVNDKLTGAISFMIATDEFYVPMRENLDTVAESIRLQKEREYLTGFLKSVNSKLVNERFMSNAKPAIIEVELKKKADAEAKLKILEENLSALAN
jgi:valyl-tRNA synthetase